MDNDKDDVKYVDAETYRGSGDQGVTFKQIVLQHLQRLAGLASKEFHGGYWKTNYTIVGGGTGSIPTGQVYIEDSGEAFSNAVDYLSDLLHPHYDEEMRKIDVEHAERLDGLYAALSERISDDEEARQAAYREEKARLKRRLFRALNDFLFRIKYLEGRAFAEEV